MDNLLRQKIIAKLTSYLNREPSDNEVINAQTDANIMHWIAQDDTAEQRTLIDAVALAANVDVSAVKASLNIIV